MLLEIKQGKTFLHSFPALKVLLHFLRLRLFRDNQQVYLILKCVSLLIHWNVGRATVFLQYFRSWNYTRGPPWKFCLIFTVLPCPCASRYFMGERLITRVIVVFVFCVLTHPPCSWQKKPSVCFLLHKRQPSFRGLLKNGINELVCVKAILPLVFSQNLTLARILELQGFSARRETS